MRSKNWNLAISRDGPYDVVDTKGGCADFTLYISIPSLGGNAGVRPCPGACHGPRWMFHYVGGEATNNARTGVSTADCQTHRRVRRLRSEVLPGWTKSGGDAQAAPFPSASGRHEHTSRRHHHGESNPAKTAQ